MVLPQPAPALFSHQTMGNNVNSSTCSSIPAFSSRAALSKDEPVIPGPSVRAYPSSPPDTPEASHSASTSPVSVSPQTLPDAHARSLLSSHLTSLSPCTRTDMDAHTTHACRYTTHEGGSAGQCHANLGGRRLTSNLSRDFLTFITTFHSSIFPPVELAGLESFIVYLGGRFCCISITILPM